jgi:MFS family permease
MGRRFDVRKALALLALVNALSLIWTGMATGFESVMLSRVLAGAAAGPVLPLSQALIALRSRPQNRGAQMGIIQAFGGSLIGAILGPLLLIPVASAWGWRAPFWASGFVCLIAAGGLWASARTHLVNVTPDQAQVPSRARAVTTRSRRNLLLCCGLSALLVSWLVITVTFVPVFLVDTLRWPPDRMGIAMSGFGVASMVSAVVIPSMSDRIGRRAAILLCSCGGALAGLAICLGGGSAWGLVAVIIVGIAGGAFPLFMAAIPAESAPPYRVASWIALVQGVGEILGGVAAPLLAGVAADRFGPRSAVGAAAACVAAAALISLLLLETNPKVRATA